MPVRLLGRGDRPLDGACGQALTDVRVLGYVSIIIVVDERMMRNRVVQGKGNHREHEAYHGVAFWKRREESRRLRLYRGCLREGQYWNLTTEGTGGHGGGNTEVTGLPICECRLPIEYAPI